MKRFVLIFLSLLVLVLVYVFQKFSYMGFVNNFLPGFLEAKHPYSIFVINKTCRLIFNDLACMLFIYAVFKTTNHLRVSFYLFLAELLVLLPIYFVLKLTLEGDSELSSPMLSQLHRLIVNPLLMILLIMGFVFQRFKSSSIH